MTSIAAAFDAETFRAEGRRVVDQLAAYLARCAHREDAVLPWVAPATMVERWPADFPVEARGTVDDLLARVIAASNHLHHPRYIGHQVTSPLPAAALCELVAALLNNGTAIYEMGPVSTAMERALVRWMSGLLGFGSDADGVFTSGGSAGNLTALLAARQAKAGWDVWGEGAAAGPPLAVLTSEQSHYSVSRSLQVMGWGRGGAVPVPVDARFRLRADALDDAKRTAERAGRRVIAVVASACSTATGAFDPLEPIADFCARHDLWFHVDGAHGASAALSEKYRVLLRGVERADSVVWDAHKMLLMPALVTAVLFRDGRRSYEAFAQEASYLFAGNDPRDEWFNGAARTLECTKRMMSVQLYTTLSVYGTRLFADYVTATFDQAERFAARLTASKDFEVAVAPECNIVCFRLRGTDDGTHERVRRALLEEGSFYLVQTKLAGRLWLRVTLINPFTTDADLDALTARIRAVAAGA